jgi:hypothetical protein
MSKPGEKRPVLVIQLESGWLSTAKNQVVIFAPLIRCQDDNDLKEAKIQFQSDVIGNTEVVKRDETTLLPPSILLIFQSVRYRIIPVDIPFLAIPCPILPSETQGLTEHEE